MSDTLYIVSGMHRSGTSLITRALQVYGIALPGDLAEPAEDNRKGFFEDKNIVEINDELLRGLGLRWDSLDGFFLDSSEFSSPRFTQLKRAAREILNERANVGRDWAIKDPRISRLTGFWMPLVEESGVPCKFVVAVRNPAEVAGSLEKRNQISHRKSLYLWLFHTLEFLRATSTKPRLVVHYEAVVEAPGRVLGVDSSFFPPADEAAKREFVEEFVDQELRHNQDVQLSAKVDLADELYLMLQSDEVPQVDHLVTAIRAGTELYTPREGQPPWLERESEVNVMADAIVEYKRNQQRLEKDLLEQQAWSSKLVSDVDSLTDDIASLNEANAEQKRVQHKLEADLGEQNSRNSQLASEVEQLRSNEARQARTLAEAIMAADRQRADSQAEYGRLWEIIEKYRMEVDQMLHSSSWRVTAPLRFVRRTVQRLPSRARSLARALVFALPPENAFRQRIVKVYERSQVILKGEVDSASVRESHRSIIDSRGVLLGLNDPRPAWSLPPLDVSIVTFNSARWVDGFARSLRSQQYPISKLVLTFVDNDSTDDTVSRLEGMDWSEFGGFRLVRNRNAGFGAGHNTGISAGAQEYVLVTNIDLEFRPDSLIRAVSFAMDDDSRVASWELRQAPYEHPKFYDPVSLQTAWSSHAAVLMRRDAFTRVGGYEEKIFMYGEDVELSYRLRVAGYRLRYLPFAVVDHYTYEIPDTVKPLQYQGSTLANAYIRMRYGSLADVLRIIPMYLKLVSGNSGVPEHKAAVRRNLLNVFRNAPYFLRRRSGSRGLSFRGWDYDIVRDGAFFESGRLPAEPPLVSVITRTYRGRDRFLVECLQSVAHQTYPNVEHVIVEDGGDSMKSTVESFQRAYPGVNIRFVPLGKVGRCEAGNQGLARARGRYLAFLDDDDLFFADHLEVCVCELANDESLSAVYALAWEVETEFNGVGYEERSHGTPATLRQAFDREVLSDHNFIPIQSIVFDRSLYEEHGGFDPELENLEDWNLWVRYASGAEFGLVEKTTSMYRTPWDVGERTRRQAELDRYLPIARAKNAKMPI